MVIVYLAEVLYDYEEGYTVGIFSTEKKAWEALEAEDVAYGKTHVSKWEVDKRSHG